MRRHWQLLLLLGVFLMPLFSALYLLGKNQTYTFNTVQYGTLVSNPKPLQFATMYQTDGTAISILPADKKWRLVYLAPEQCADECQQRKKLLANLQVALGANQDRLQILTSTANKIKAKHDTDSILLLNPDGLYIMHYPANANASSILKDIKRLLKYSHD